MSSQQANKQKQSYRRPQLTIYGHITQLTQLSLPSGATNDNVVGVLRTS